MPIESGAIRGRIERQHPCGQGVIFPIEENQLDTGCAAGKNAEIHPSGRYLGAERSASSSRLDIRHGRYKSSFADDRAQAIVPPRPSYLVTLWHVARKQNYSNDRINPQERPEHVAQFAIPKSTA